MKKVKDIIIYQAKKGLTVAKNAIVQKKEIGIFNVDIK